MSAGKSSKKIARGIWPALCTPFGDGDGGGVDSHRTRALLRHLIDAGSDGFFVCGGTGEGRVLTVPERKQMAEVTICEVAGAVPVILQVGATTTDNAVDLARHAASIGSIDAVASVAPEDRPNDLAAAVEHYAAIGAATDLPFYVYWLANTADRSVVAEQYLAAMEGVPNFSGVKFTDHNFYLFQQLIDLSDGKLNAITGPDEMCLPGMVMGSDAAIGTTYNIMPRLFLQMRKDFEAGNLADAMLAQTRANRVISALAKVGVLAGTKAMLGWRGVPVGPPRAVEPLSAEGERQLRQALAALDFDVA